MQHDNIVKHGLRGIAQLYTSSYAGIQPHPLSIPYYVLPAANGVIPGVAICTLQ